MTTQAIRKILIRDFILCFFAQFTFTFVIFSLIPTLPIYLSRLGSKEVEIGVLIGSSAVASLVLRPFVGRALLKIPEKQLYDRRRPLFCLRFDCLYIRSPFLAFFDGERLTGNWVRPLHDCLVYLDRQNQLRGSYGTKSQLFYLGLHDLRRISPSHGNVANQHLQFHLPLPGLPGFIVMFIIHYSPIGKGTSRSIAGFFHPRWFLSQPEISSTVHHCFLPLLHLGSFNHLFPPLCNQSWGDQSRAIL